MKILIDNVTGTSNNSTAAATTAPAAGGDVKGEGGTTGKSTGGLQKMCRYGENCTRSNCRFKHPGQQQQQSDKSTPATVTSSSSSTSTGSSSTSSSSTSLSQLYFTHSWLPTHIKVELLDKGNVNISKLTNTDLESPVHKVSGRRGDRGDRGDRGPGLTQAVLCPQEPSEDVKQVVRYDLAGVVCHITENEEKKNLISFINVGPGYHKRKCRTTHRQWYIFNDFSVTPVPEQEVTWFSMEWKVPCVLYWVDRDMPTHFVPETISNPVTVDVFGEDKCLARDRGRKRITFTPLGVDEMPRKGELVAMDAEFVSLNQEEAELRSDGKLSTVKPSHRSVARITCVRGYVQQCYMDVTITCQGVFLIVPKTY
jgi:PAB-dependent poly(A)-specific ribonuclease subunit 2